MQALILVNAERQDRGLGALQLDDTLLSQIDFNHSLEMAQYNYQAHSSPINQSEPLHSIRPASEWYKIVLYPAGQASELSMSRSGGSANFCYW